MSERLSVFDMFKVGVGPSSSHTLGPWRAALAFVAELQESHSLARVTEVTVDLFGSLAKTGHGHGTDRAVQAGLIGLDPETCDVDALGPTFTANLTSGDVVSSTWYSIGGGFIVRDGETAGPTRHVSLPYPIDTAADLL